jgi:hypothetical protein
VAVSSDFSGAHEIQIADSTNNGEVVAVLPAAYKQNLRSRKYKLETSGMVDDLTHRKKAGWLHARYNKNTR